MILSHFYKKFTIFFKNPLFEWQLFKSQSTNLLA
jgi:hypothetical protein